MDTPDCPFAIVESVTIVKVTQDTVTFSTRSAGAEERQRLLRNFTCPRTEILTRQPNGGPQPVALIRGATGKLYLSRTGWETTADGFRIYGAGTAAVVFKWPLCLAVPVPRISTLQVVPTSIVIRGFLTGTQNLVSFELFSSECADSQTINWNGAQDIEIKLARTTITMWPTSIVVRGAPTSQPDVPGRADILERELAAPVQRLQFDRASPAVSLELTQDGISRFHVVSDLVRAIAAGQRIDDARHILDEWTRIGAGELSEASRRTLEAARAEAARAQM